MISIHGMDIREYHTHPAISKTTLDLIARDPHLVAWSRSAPIVAEKMGALDFGDALHALLLEPERLDRDFAVAPECNMRTNDGKAAYADFVAENAGKRIISAEDRQQLTVMFDSVMAHRQARELLEAAGDIERSFFWRDDATGLECKCRPDKTIASRGLLVDVKSTSSIAKFAYAVEDYRYYVQAPWYCDGVDRFGLADRMAFLVVQKTVELGRYPVQVFTLPEELILYGRQTYRRNLDTYAHFLKSETAQDRIQELEIHSRFIDQCVESLDVTI